MIMNFRPFNDEELKELLGRSVKTKKRGDLSIITDVTNHYDEGLNDGYVTIFAHGRFYTSLELLKDCVFLDGKPCGVEMPNSDVIDNLNKAIGALEKVSQCIKSYDNLLISDCIKLLIKDKERLSE